MTVFFQLVMQMRLGMNIQLHFHKAPLAAKFYSVIRKTRSSPLLVAFTLCIKRFLLAQHLQKVVHIKSPELNFQRKQPAVFLRNIQPVFRVVFFVVAAESPCFFFK